MGGENSRKPESMQGSWAGDAGWDYSLKTYFPPGDLNIKGQDMPRLVPKAAHRPAGASPGVTGQSCQGNWHLLCLGAKEKPLMRSLCQQQEPGLSHCRPTGKGWGYISPHLGTLLLLRISRNRLVRGC